MKITDGDIISIYDCTSINSKSFSALMVFISILNGYLVYYSFINMELIKTSVINLIFLLFIYLKLL